MLKHLLLPFLFGISTLAAAEFEPAAAPVEVYPLQAELVVALDTAKVKVDQPVLAKLLREWGSAPCTLPRGSVLMGRIVSLDPRSNTSKLTSVSLLFEAPCAGSPALPLTWIALLSPDNSDLAGVHGGDPVAVQALRSTSFGEDNGLGVHTNTQANHTDLSGRQNPNLPLFVGPSPDRAVPRPDAVFTGQVWHIPNLSLSVATGRLGSTVVSSTSKSLRIPRGSVFVLSPNHAAPASLSTASVPHPNPSVANSTPTPPREVFATDEACAPPTCSVARHSGRIAQTDPSPIQTLSLSGLGYLRLKSAEMLDFEYGAALAYIGADRLLLTFNPHTLIPRIAGDDPTSHPHMVRAILFNLETSAVETVVDWRVGDDRQYLWPLGDGLVLVHSGERLRLLGSKLRELAAVPLSSPLAFVRSAPDRKHIAVGVIRELHTPEVHTALTVASSNSPEEEVSVLLFNDHLEATGATRQSSFAFPPVLSDSGRITLLHAGGEHWRYQETSWASEKRTVVRVNSACLPDMKSLASNLLFVTGCDTSTIGRWYRILRLNGSAVLKGNLLSTDTQPFSLASRSGEAFAVALPTARNGYSPTSPFHGTDLSSEAVRVYRSTDGQILFTADMHAPTPTRQPMAFDPGGTRLAMLDDEQIVIYAMPSTAETQSAISHPSH